MNCVKTIAAAAALFIATAQVTVVNAGPPGDENFKATFIRANVVKGKTSTDDVLAKFGEPSSQTMDDTSETWVYQRGAATAAQSQQKKGPGLGGFMGLVKSVAATAYEIAPDKMGSAAGRIYSGADRVERTANAAGALSAASGAGSQSQSGGAAGPSVLQINFTNGIVRSFNLR